MKKIWGYLKSHLIHDFDKREYLLTGTLLVAGLSLNYTFDFEDDILDEQTGLFKFFCYYLFYALPFYAVLSFQRNLERNFWKDKMFWIKSQFGLVILALDGSVPYLNETISAYVPEDLQYWIYKVTVNGISFCTVFIPILVFYKIYDRDSGHAYGLSPKKFDVKPYFVMLLIMLPLLIGASFHKSFLRQYPMYNTSDGHLYLGVPEWVTVLGYELAYGFDFITLEFLFRGFMILALVPLVGRRAVLAMATIYCFLHFGKPAGEAISSIFGGYILGVIALETRSIWGGVIVHLGIAWLMEIIGFIQQIRHDA